MKPFVFTVVFLLIASAVYADYGTPLVLPGVSTAADPEVLEVDGVYYLYVTSSNLDFSCWSSTDLVTWTNEGVVFPQPAEGSWNDYNVWAPEVHRNGNDFYLYYAANMMLGVAHATSPTGPFVDVYDHPFIGGGYGGVAGLAIDAHLFRDDDGQLYLYYAGYMPFSSIRVVPMVDMVTPADEAHRTLVEPGIWNWEMFVAEGPWMVKHDGRYYLMYSGWGADRPNYAVGYATADDPLGPFAEATENPILHRDDDAEIYGPGHNGVVTAPGGQLQIVYHTKQFVTIGWDREIRLNDLCFSESDKMYVGLDGCTVGPDDDAADDDQTDDDATDHDATDDDAATGEGEEGDDDSGCGG